MEYRHVGKWGVKVSAVSLGSWLTYGGATGDDAARTCIERAYDLGINFFDTANAYAKGEAERVVGKALKAYRRESYFLATKCFFPVGDGPNDRGLSRKHIIEACNQSLQRLGLDYIDLYQCHRFDTGTPLEETLFALDHLVRQGKILYAGVSEWNGAQISHACDLVRAHNLSPIVSNQPLYNMLHRKIEEDVIPVCEREGIGQVVFSPLAQGLLTGKYKPGQPVPTDSRAADPSQNMFMNHGKLDDGVLEKVEKLHPIAAELDLTLAQLALAWILRQKNVSSVIVGASRVSQIEDNAAAAGKIIPAAALEQIEGILADD